MPYDGGKVNNVTALSQLIAHRIEYAPFERDGHMWAAAAQQWWCDHLGVSPATLRRIIAKPPFVRDQTHVDHKRCTLLRIGEEGPKTERHYRNILSKMWRGRVDRPTSKIEFGCICGLIEAWPEGKAPEIFKLVLDDWPAFMAGVKIEAPTPKYFTYPSLRVIRRFPHIAVDLMAMQDQAKLASKHK